MAVLAVDGGNTKTVAVVAADDGTLRGTSLGGCTDLYGAPSAGAALDELYRVIDGALEAAGVTPQELSGPTLSLAGADWDDDFALHRATADERLPGVPVEVVNDAVGPIRCAARDGAGVSLICGTGAAIGARSPDGRSWHIGFTPRNSGAHALGKEALAAIQEADMDCGRATRLTERLLAVFGVAAPRDIVHAVTRRGGLSASDVAALAPHVLAVAADGDAVARDIVDLAGQRHGLLDAARGAAGGPGRRLPPRCSRAACSGARAATG
jgi:N-acetylglucosamine kinase-like BadF-type ATPase